MRILSGILLSSVLTLLCLQGLAQDVSQEDMFVEKEFVIIRSTTDYEAALQTARSAASRLQLKLDLRDLKKNKESGLSFSKKVCEEEWEEYPCYVARGRWDDGNYISIEYSDAYNGFRKGYYIVIIAGGEKGDALVKTILTKAKKYYKDAYSKTTKVYIGCMH
jgi:hypothetical protein